MSISKNMRRNQLHNEGREKVLITVEGKQNTLFFKSYAISCIRISIFAMVLCPYYVSKDIKKGRKCLL